MNLSISNPVIDWIEVGQQVIAAGSLLLNEPDAAFQDLLKQAGYREAEARQLRQLFFDRLGIPQSGLYLPPYEHVFKKRTFSNGIWHFPPARFDGAGEVESIYQEWGFNSNSISTSSLLKSANIPGDHLGFMLTFAGFALQKVTKDPGKNNSFADSLRQFIDRHLDNWVDDFCEVLPLAGKDDYLKALADAQSEAVDLLRSWRAEDRTLQQPLDASVPVSRPAR